MGEKESIRRKPSRAEDAHFGRVTGRNLAEMLSAVDRSEGKMPGKENSKSKGPEAGAA